MDRLGTAPPARTYEMLGPLSKESHAWKASEILGLLGEIGKATSLTRGIVLHVAVLAVYAVGAYYVALVLTRRRLLK